METSYHPFLLWKWKNLLLIQKYNSEVFIPYGRIFFQNFEGFTPFGRNSFFLKDFLWKDLLLMEGFSSYAIGRISLLCNWKDFPLMQLEGFPSCGRIFFLWKDFLIMEGFSPNGRIYSLLQEFLLIKGFAPHGRIYSTLKDIALRKYNLLFMGRFTSHGKIFSSWKNFFLKEIYTF